MLQQRETEEKVVKSYNRQISSTSSEHVSSRFDPNVNLKIAEKGQCTPRKSYLTTTESNHIAKFSKLC